jgi:hypothetical protein
VIAGEFGACGHGGDQEGWALGGNPDLQVATRSIWFTRSHPDLSDRHKTALNEIENQSPVFNAAGEASGKDLQTIPEVQCQLSATGLS